MNIKNTEVSLKGMTEEIFDVVIAVAKAHGLDWVEPDGKTDYYTHKRNAFIIFKENIFYSYDCNNTDCKELSVEDFLFSLVDDDVASSIGMRDGKYYYMSNGAYIPIGSSTGYKFGWDGQYQEVEFKKVYTRIPACPKDDTCTDQGCPHHYSGDVLGIGYECLILIRGGSPDVFKKCTVTFIGNKYIIFTDENGREYSRKKSKVKIKSIPKEPESKEKFTKGDWLIADGDGTFVYALNDRQVNQFSFSVCGNGKQGATLSELQANAELLCLAPNMYYTVKRLAKLLEGVITCGSEKFTLDIHENLHECQKLLNKIQKD